MEAQNTSLHLRGDSRLSKAHNILNSMNLLDQSTTGNESSFGRFTPQTTTAMSRFGGGFPSFNTSYQSMSDINNTAASFNNVVDVVKDVADTEPIYAAYMAIFSDFNQVTNANNYEDLMELAGLYEQLCIKCGSHIEDLLSEMQDGPGRHTAQHMIKLLKFEKQTWRLVVSLYKDRIASENQMDDDDEETNDDLKYQSEKELVQDYLNSDNQVRQAQIVVDWLEQNAADDLDAQVEKADQYMSGVMWENSLYQLRKSKESGEKSPHPKYITEMDPDAPTRQKRTLVDLDLQDEGELLNAIHACIRAGRIDEAQGLCVTHGQAWRAASLEGWRLYHDPNFISTSDEYQVTEGNPTRTMWKSTCWALSHNCEYSTKERAVYGALSGNLSAMLDDCNKWEDYVWAYYKTLLDVSVEKKLTEAPNVRVPIQRRHLMKLSTALNLPEKFWLQKVSLNEQEKIFDTISASHNSEVRKQAKYPYNITQRCIILNSISKLVDEMMSWVDGEDFDPQILRFSTHLLLFFRDLGEGIDMEHFNVIMQKYVRFLSSDSRTSSLVASYCSSLPEGQQISSYADLLEPIEDPLQRRHYFHLAANAGLQINDITRTVVDRIRAGDVGLTSFTSLLHPQQGDHPDIEQTTTPQDMKKIQSLEWLVIDPSHRFEAVYQCNAIMRTFLGAGKFQAASQAYDQLPDDSIDLVYREWQAKTDVDVPLPARCDNAINERICIVSYLEAQVAFRNWFKHFHSDKPKVSTDFTNESSLTSVSFQPLAGNVSLTNIVAGELQETKNKEKLHEWNERLMMLCNIATEKIYNVLLFPGGWLVDKRATEEENQVDEDDEMRHRQMALLRQLCIPILCNLLLTVLRNTEGKSFECTKLADVIADESTRIYKLFTKAEGKKFFCKIQDILIDCI